MMIMMMMIMMILIMLMMTTLTTWKRRMTMINKDDNVNGSDDVDLERKQINTALHSFAC